MWWDGEPGKLHLDFESEEPEKRWSSYVEDASEVSEDWVKADMDRMSRIIP